MPPELIHKTPNELHTYHPNTTPSLPLHQRLQQRGNQLLHLLHKLQKNVINLRFLHTDWYIEFAAPVYDYGELNLRDFLVLLIALDDAWEKDVVRGGLFIGVFVV